MNRTALALLAAVAVIAAAGAATSSAGSAPTVNVTPKTVQRGHTITVTGRYWPPNVTVQLLIGPPRSEADRVGSARTTSRGSFRRSLRLPAWVRPGLRVMLACRRDCRDKDTTNFRVTR